MVKVRSSAIAPPLCWRNSSAAGRSAPSGSGWRMKTAYRRRRVISTEITMTAREIIDAYALRWTIEPMFCALKHGIGVKETWQRRRQTPHRWVQILSTAFALTQMMAVYDPVIARQLAIVAPWRKERHPTAGMIKRGLAAMFRNVSLLAVWDRKCRKFSAPIAPHPRDIRDAA